MFKNFNSAACVAAMAMLSVASVSCQKDQTNSIGQIVDHAGYYFNESQQSKNFSRTMDFITEAGTYDIVGATNLLQGEYPTMYTDPKSSFGKDALTTLTGVRDVCLGTTSLTVKPSQINYTTSVQAYHIMAQLGVSISGVPSDITELSVTLPSQSNQFDFSGKFYGSSQSIELNVMKSDSPASDGSYTWSATEQLIYPSCNAATEGESVPSTMPLTVVAKDTNGKTYTFNTSTTTRCTPGTRTKLSSTWNAINCINKTTMSINAWQSTQQTGSFDLN